MLAVFHSFLSKQTTQTCGEIPLTVHIYPNVVDVFLTLQSDVVLYFQSVGMATTQSVTFLVFLWRCLLQAPHTCCTAFPCFMLYMT